MLRHKVYFEEMEAVERSVEKRDVVPRFKPPKTVNFRRGGDLNAVVEAAKADRYIQVNAAVGSGKSTKCPMLLAKAMGALVIHTIPFGIAARYLAEYLQTMADGDRVVFVDDVASDMPQHGVAIVTNAFFHAKMARDKFAGLQGAILYLDEIHESDAPTAVLRDVAPAMGIFRCVVRATATSDPGTRLAPDLPGSRLEKKYNARSVATWSANDVGVPWGSSMIEGNTMIAIDRADVRVRLAAEYRHHGFEVRLCDSHTDYEYFRDTVRMLSDRNSGLIIVLVDYAYRSSLTIPNLNCLIDSCEVGVSDVDARLPTKKYRTAYDFEVQQFLGRGGRLPGETVHLWRSSDPSPKYMCDLEKLECDAANLLYRLLGFRPPPCLIEYDFYEGSVPIDIAAAFVSDSPLTLCPEESRVAWINGHIPLREEKEREVHQYRAPARGRFKPVSCHTLIEQRRPVTPPPPVPSVYRRTAVDVEALEAFSSSRDSSPGAGTVFTIQSDEHDNVSIFQDPDYLASIKPKRVAKRVLEERAAAAAARAEADGVVDQLGVQLARSATVHSEAMVAAPVLEKSRSFHDMGDVVRDLRDRTAGELEVLPADDRMLGRYVHYPGIDKAPDKSSRFVDGLESICRYCEHPNARFLAQALPELEKLHAMKLLVDQSNRSLAIVVGIQRLFAEMRERSVAEWRSFIDREQLQRHLTWMAGRCTEAQDAVRLSRNLMPFFMRYDLDYIDPAEGLEHRVMIQMMERLEHTAVKKDPDKVDGYLQRLNSMVLDVRPRRHGRHRSSFSGDFG